MPHRLACVTAEPIDLPSHVERIEPPKDFEDVRIPSWPEARPQCLRRLAMFAPDAGDTFGERFVCMDLDCVISGPLDPLFEGGEDFRICAGTAASRPYNGSMFMLRAGSRPAAYLDFTPERAAAAGKRYFGSDQAWIAQRLPGEPTWGAADGVVFNGLASIPPEERRVMFFAGETKPWMRAGNHWIDAHYRAEPRGKALVLGALPEVWAEAEAALEEHQFDGVIASPEAAEHWPGKVDAIGRDDWEAVRLARMMGFESVVLCGVDREAI